MPMTKNDGGPAYPETHYGPTLTQTEPGMRLRDYVAAKVLQGLVIANSNPSHAAQVEANAIQGGVLVPEEMARTAYSLADAMLTERHKADKEE